MILLLLLVLMIAGFGVLGWWVLLHAENRQEAAERNAESILDATFDGREDVSFTVNLKTLKYETVVIGAKQRGYRLTSQEDTEYGPRALVFEKITPAE